MRETETSRRRMGLKTKILLTLLALLIAGGAILAAFLCGLRQAGGNQTPEITSDLLTERLRSVQELVTVSYYYTNMGRFENQMDFYGWKVPFTTKSFIVSYDGAIKAGVDLSEVTVRIDEENRAVTVTLPAGKILSHEIPEDSIQIFDESNNIFNSITIEDYTGFTAEQKSILEQRAIDNGLLAEAEEKARTTVQAFLSLMPGMDAYTLRIQ